jgi:hypothetical protein
MSSLGSPSFRTYPNDPEGLYRARIRAQVLADKTGTTTVIRYVNDWHSVLVDAWTDEDERLHAGLPQRPETYEPRTMALC